MTSPDFLTEEQKAALEKQGIEVSGIKRVLDGIEAMQYLIDLHRETGKSVPHALLLGIRNGTMFLALDLKDEMLVIMKSDDPLLRRRHE
jgi:hypothetical protein